MRRERRPGYAIRFLLACTAVGAALTGTPGRVPAEVPAPGASRACGTVGTWRDLKTGAAMAAADILGSLATRNIVLLGESHGSAEDHRWQLHTLAGLHAHRSDLAVGFEMFPRSVQPALDDWSNGRHSEADFLEAARWREVWGFAPEYYMPLFHFARQNRLPMIALNVDRRLVSRVAREGWRAIPEDDREGISDPAPASDAYRRSLAAVYAEKQTQGIVDPLPSDRGEEPREDEAGRAPDLSAILESEGFARFVEAQLTWDRAMAEALVQAGRDNPEALVVGILGRGHVEHGYGVPHQLADLGEDSVAALLPVEPGGACAALEAQVADAVFVVAPDEGAPAAPARPRLGVMIEQADDGVRVLDVVEGSVAQATGLEPGDIIVSAATFPVARVADLIEIVQRQAPGTLLPLELRRDGETRRLLAEFPSRFE